MRFFRQEYWSGLPYPPPGDLSIPGIELASPVSSALQVDSSSTFLEESNKKRYKFFVCLIEFRGEIICSWTSVFRAFFFFF